MSAKEIGICVALLVAAVIAWLYADRISEEAWLIIFAAWALWHVGRMIDGTERKLQKQIDHLNEQVRQLRGF